MKDIRNLRRYLKNLKVIKSFYVKALKLLGPHKGYELNRRLRSPYSSIEKSNRVIFVHIPKAAGNAVVRSIWGGEATGHDSLERYYNCNQKLFHNSYRFTFVRNPWDRIVSAFFYLKQGGIGYFDKQFACKYLKEIDTFESFVLTLDQDPNFRDAVMKWVHFIPQIEFLKINGKELECMNFVGKVENFQQDMIKLCDHLGIKPDKEIKVINASERNQYREYYNINTQAIVAKLYNADIQAFNYEF